MSHQFIKMNGLGNDFVVVQAEKRRFAPSPEQVRAIADRAAGIGCDQVIAIEPSQGADAFMRVWNADGGEITACGNGARCVGWLLMAASGRDEAEIETAAGFLGVRRAYDGMIIVDMGSPVLAWSKIPLVRAMETREINLTIDYGISAPGVVSMGNPHVVFFVDDVETVDVERVGPIVENDPLFPERINVGFAQIKSHNEIRLRVWERGVGLTRACGTGACAAVVAAYRRQLAGRNVMVEMDGGDLHIEWRDYDRHVLMTGPAAVEFVGVLPDI
jgi:diaminopimelate epimerase